MTRSPIYGLGQARSGRGPGRSGIGKIEAERRVVSGRIASMVVVITGDFPRNAMDPDGLLTFGQTLVHLSGCGRSVLEILDAVGTVIMRRAAAVRG